MTTYLLTIGLILILMLAWVVVQQSYKLFARRHPEMGPFRKDGGGCGGCCSSGDCADGSCESEERHS